MVLFLWLKIAINFQEWVYRGMGDIFLIGILGLMHMNIVLWFFFMVKNCYKF